MKRFSGRAASVALALAMAGSPAYAGGYGWHGGHGWHGGSSHHHHGGGSDGWWVAGVFGLAAAGLLLAANSGPTYVQTGVYAPGVAYTSPPVYAAPPAVAYVEPQPQYAPVQYEPAKPADTAQARAETDCQRWAVNQSGYDPATISQWTTQVMVDSYNRALDSCMTSRGYRAR
ncbi:MULTISPECIES: hypothetical protein [unclassified Achromobacter]|jgi:hypothetical protein|uniref:hypothetical protein n=1 Tax=unclassified Achromobacter TaxID=2626865 RepID=UPI00069E7C91|nr:MULTISPECIES: hypothetical protein [unclassified Achromobacter]KOF51970.1 hypothetical protein AD428_23300 [Achromobacter sp. DMS1]